MSVVELHPEAEAEVDVGIAWYEQQWEGLGLEFLAEVDSAMERIVRSPDQWRPYSDIPEVHRLNVHRFPYCVVYRYRQDRIQIVAIAHQRRKPGYWSGRLRDFDRHQEGARDV